MLYVIKICQIQRRSLQEDKDQEIMDRVNYFLRKIVILTLMYFFLGFVTLLILSLQSASIPGLIAIVIDILVTCYSLRLMIESNDEEYIEFIHKFNIRYLCCCLFVNITSELNGEDSNKPVINVTVSPPMSPRDDEDKMDGDSEEKKELESSWNTKTDGLPQEPVTYRHRTAPTQEIDFNPQQMSIPQITQLSVDYMQKSQSTKL